MSTRRRRSSLCSKIGHLSNAAEKFAVGYTRTLSAKFEVFKTTDEAHSWQFYVVQTALMGLPFLSAIQNLSIRYASVEIKHGIPVGFVVLLSSLMCIIVWTLVLLVKHCCVQAWFYKSNPFIYMHAVVAGVLSGISILLVFVALTREEATSVTIYFQLGMICLLPLDAHILKAAPGPSQILTTLVLIAGTISYSENTKEEGYSLDLIAPFLAFSGFVLNYVANVLIEKVMQTEIGDINEIMDPFSVLFVKDTVKAIVAVVYIAISERDYFEFDVDWFVPSLLCVLCVFVFSLGASTVGCVVGPYHASVYIAAHVSVIFVLELVWLMNRPISLLETLHLLIIAVSVIMSNVLTSEVQGNLARTKIDLIDELTTVFSAHTLANSESSENTSQDEKSHTLASSEPLQNTSQNAKTPEITGTVKLD